MNKIFIYLILFLLLITPIVYSTVLSIDKTEFVSSISELAGSGWRVLFRVDNSPEQLTSIKPSSIQGTNEKGQKITNEQGFNMAMKISQQSCDYKLSTTSERSLKLAQFYTGTSWTTSSTLVTYNTDTNFNTMRLGDVFNLCVNNGGVPIIYDKGFFSFYRYSMYCFKSNEVGIPGNSQSRINFKVNVDITKDDGTPLHGEKVFNLGTLQEGVDSSISLGDQGIAKYVGSAGTGELCPSPSDKAVKPIHNFQTWVFSYLSSYTAANTKFDDYTNKLVSLYNQQSIKDIKFITDKSKIDDLVSYAVKTGYSQSVARGDAYLDYDGTKATISNSDKSQGQARIILPSGRLVFYPDISLTLKAEWLGIKILAGEPQIVECKDTTFTEGSNLAKMNIVVKNKGNEPGQFGSSASCSTQFSPSASISTITLKPGESGNIEIPVTVDTNKDVSGECNINIFDTSYPENKDSVSCKLKASPISFNCKAGEQSCIGNTQWVCNTQGQFINTNKLCETNVTDGGGKGNYTSCILSNEDIKVGLTEKECCDAKGGKYTPPKYCEGITGWVEKGLGLCHDQESTCSVPNYPLISILMIVGGLGLTAWTRLDRKLTKQAKQYILIAGLILLGIGILWLSLASMGYL